jgi:phosphoribosylaminoimidazolecarboxamide formyltransferase/IMP cyclohydrolase
MLPWRAILNQHWWRINLQRTIDKATAPAINEIFFEVLIAPKYDDDALEVLRSKKNRILLRAKSEVRGRSQICNVPY